MKYLHQDTNKKYFWHNNEFTRIEHNLIISGINAEVDGNFRKQKGLLVVHELECLLLLITCEL